MAMFNSYVSLPEGKSHKNPIKSHQNIIFSRVFLNILRARLHPGTRFPLHLLTPVLLGDGYMSI